VIFSVCLGLVWFGLTGCYSEEVEEDDDDELLLLLVLLLVLVLVATDEGEMIFSIFYII